ncbi:hypothetical protein [Asticcacaulis sp. YBE204]|uniref:hypothetical protein n=1 Tax=Asticcacaulis sp. YBE204 TaxID=1282363 RepID=UPI0012DC2CD7|nr:hypothetical protein [Asticcacaulis sp. YBE204]
MNPRFDKHQITKCYHNLDKAKEALSECRNAQNYNQFANSWADFLTRSGSIIHAIEGGSQATPQGRQWYGSIRKRDKNDELLSYMYQARNEVEHGRNTVIETAVPFPFGLVNPETNELEPFLTIDPNRAKVEKTDSGFILTWERNPKIMDEKKNWKLGIGIPRMGLALIPIIDSKFGTVFKVPTTHNGQQLNTKKPIEIGEIYISHLVSFIKEAESMS